MQPLTPSYKVGRAYGEIQKSAKMGCSRMISIKAAILLHRFIHSAS